MVAVKSADTAAGSGSVNCATCRVLPAFRSSIASGTGVTVSVAGLTWMSTVVDTTLPSPRRPGRPAEGTRGRPCSSRTSPSRVMPVPLQKTSRNFFRCRHYRHEKATDKDHDQSPVIATILRFYSAPFSRSSVSGRLQRACRWGRLIGAGRRQIGRVFRNQCSFGIRATGFQKYRQRGPPVRADLFPELRDQPPNSGFGLFSGMKDRTPTCLPRG